MSKALLGVIGSTSSTSFSPSQISGLAVWLDASAYSAGTWTDKSGNGRNSTGTGTLVPLAINGKPAVLFNGTSTFFSGSAPNTTSSVSVFVVATMNTLTESYGCLVNLVGALVDASAENLNALQRNIDAQGIVTIRTNAPLSSKSIPNYDTPFSAATIVNGTTDITYVNGVAGTSVPTSGTFAYTTLNFGSSNGFLRWWKGYIAEVIVYNTALLDVDRLRIETYLASKYSIVAAPPDVAPTTTVAFSYTGGDQSFVVPTTTFIHVYMWGAGGGSYGGNQAGAGAMVQGRLSVSAGQMLTIVVGQTGGQNYRAYGGGGVNNREFGSGGGGRSAIRLGGAEMVSAGAGCGSGWNAACKGGAGSFKGTASPGQGSSGNREATGGSKTGGGIAGASSFGAGTDGIQFQGGDCGSYGAGGGGGFYGGGAGSSFGNGVGGGGGGSSFTDNLTLS